MADENITDRLGPGTQQTDFSAWKTGFFLWLKSQQTSLSTVIKDTSCSCKESNSESGLSLVRPHCCSRAADVLCETATDPEAYESEEEESPIDPMDGIFGVFVYLFISSSFGVFV